MHLYMNTHTHTHAHLICLLIPLHEMPKMTVENLGKLNQGDTE